MSMLDEDNNQFIIDKWDFSVNIDGDKLKFDVCFNTIHGPPWENWQMQWYRDIIGQKYTWCWSYESALTFNKKDTLAVLEKYGINCAKNIYIKKMRSDKL